MIVKLGDSKTKVFTFIDRKVNTGICFAPNGDGVGLNGPARLGDK